VCHSLAVVVSCASHLQKWDAENTGFSAVVGRVIKLLLRSDNISFEMHQILLSMFVTLELEGSWLRTPEHAAGSCLQPPYYAVLHGAYGVFRCTPVRQCTITFYSLLTFSLKAFCKHLRYNKTKLCVLLFIIIRVVQSLTEVNSVQATFWELKYFVQLIWILFPEYFVGCDKAHVSSRLATDLHIAFTFICSLVLLLDITVDLIDRLKARDQPKDSDVNGWKY
jgi:hypothetical protein